MLVTFIEKIIKLLLRMRYSIQISGLSEIRSERKHGMLFVPNHPALIDPLIIYTALWSKFRPRPLIEESQLRYPGMKFMVGQLKGVLIPDVLSGGTQVRETVNKTLEQVIKALKEGENVILYPAGRTYRSKHEELRGTSAVHTILQEIPDLEVVMIRTRGLWGSTFSRADGLLTAIDFKFILRAIFVWFINGIFFIPKRKVEITVKKPSDLPREASRQDLNSYLEEFYNDNTLPNTIVAKYFWKGNKPIVKPEPGKRGGALTAKEVNDATKELVLNHLKQELGVSKIKEADRLAADLGMDSLARAELVTWIESEFGFASGDPDSVITVADVMLAASGNTVGNTEIMLKEVPASWFKKSCCQKVVDAPVGKNIAEAFLNIAQKDFNKVIIADQKSGTKSYRNIITGIFALKGQIEQLQGEYVGIMLPASVGSVIFYFATLFAGKIPVMVNWTTGERNISHSINSLGVKHIITAKELIQKLAKSGTTLTSIEDKFFYVENLAQIITKGQKIKALINSYVNWKKLYNAPIKETGVVLFTSGSESLPKSVPLSHENQISNIAGIFENVKLYNDDKLIAFLPPFHSFGIEVCIIMTVCTGVSTVYYPIPTDSLTLGKMIAAYKATLMAGTPTFVSGIVNASTSQQLETLRISVTGAEKCPDHVYKALKNKCENAKILEGYGITECSPVVSVNPSDDSKPGTIGKVLPNIEYTLVHAETGESVGEGKDGILLLRGPSIFKGYLNYEGDTPFVSTQGKRWYKTGDLVNRDENGFLTFKGRIKRFVKIGGEMISLPAIESVLVSHYSSEHDEGPVIAVESITQKTDDRPELILFSVLELTREEVNKKIKEGGLSPLHNIRRVVKLDTIPILGTGKINYRELTIQ